MAREESEKERVKRMLEGFFQSKDKPGGTPETEEQEQQGLGKNIKIIIGDFASDLNLPESFNIPLPTPKNIPNEIRDLRYTPQSEELFLIKKQSGENKPPTIIKLADEDWVEYGPTVLNALMDIKNSQNPPPIPQKP